MSIDFIDDFLGISDSEANVFARFWMKRQNYKAELQIEEPFFIHSSTFFAL